ncbi:MAG: guanylate kinase [Thermoguttaceae bacterium]
MSGRIIIVSGPSGAGKGTVLAEVFTRSPLPLVFSVSATTRKPRAGEVDGKHYYFLSPEDFDDKRRRGEFLECFEVYGSGWYGTLAQPVADAVARGEWIVLEIDVAGGMHVKTQCPDAVTIFIAPPSIEILTERLTKRGSESPESLQRRIACATRDMSYASNYDICIVNDCLETAVAEMCTYLENLNTGEIR